MTPATPVPPHSTSPATPPLTHAEITKCISDTSESAVHLFGIAKVAFDNLKTYASGFYFYLQKHVEQIDITAKAKQANEMCTDAEKIFNMLECLPVIGWISGSIRHLFGQAQAVSGIALAALSETGVYFCSEKEEDLPLKKKWEHLSKIGIEMVIHGCFNMIRGSIAAYIGSYTLGAGNLLLIAPNMINGRNFNPYYGYKEI